VKRRIDDVKHGKRKPLEVDLYAPQVRQRIATLVFAMLAGRNRGRIQGSSAALMRGILIRRLGERLARTRDLKGGPAHTSTIFLDIFQLPYRVLHSKYHPKFRERAQRAVCEELSVSKYLIIDSVVVRVVSYLGLSPDFDWF
jgi:hypothetical protein